MTTSPSPSEKQHSNSKSTESSFFSDQLQDKILPFAKRFSCATNEAILLHGNDANSFYFVSKGAVEVSYTAGETKITVAIIGAGTFFGEIGFFDQGSRVRDIKALEETEIQLFNQEIMDHLQQTEPLLFSSFVLFLTKGICQKFRRVLEEREPFRFKPRDPISGHRELQDPVSGVGGEPLAPHPL